MEENPTPSTLDGPCTCDGCWVCKGAEVGCACDVDWDQLHEGAGDE